MPLTLAPTGEESIILKIGGSQDVKQHLENLGFNVGGVITVISEISGNIIVKVKESRIALDKSMAQKIFVWLNGGWYENIKRSRSRFHC